MSPLAWQMHLLSKSWWIFSLNSKSKTHFPSPYLLWKPFMSAMPPNSPSNHSLKKRQWKKTSLRILIITPRWACAMNGINVHTCVCVCVYTSYKMNEEYVVLLYHCYLPDIPFTNCVVIIFSLPRCFCRVLSLFSVFKATLISLSGHSLQSTSAALLHLFVLSTASLLEWQLTESF